LVDIINSPVFKEARSMQPFNCDHRRPCPIIDNMEVLPYLHKKWSLEPTHKDAERILTDLREIMCQTSDSYAKELEELDRQRAEMAKAE
jgi:hypothetical protein